MAKKEVKKEPKTQPVPKSQSGSYTAKDIYVLEGLEPVRKRPGMYIGSTGIDGLHHLIWEVFDNSLDEAMAGHAKNIEVTLLPGSRVRVKDDGRGIPVETHKQTGKSALETVMSTLHAGGKFGGEAYKVSGGLHGVGVSVVNALSIWLKAEVMRDGELYEQEYERGKAKKPVKKIGKTKERGTIVTFEPDPTIFEEIRFDWETILNHLRQQAYLTRGVKITITDGRKPLVVESKKGKYEAPLEYTFYFEGGIVSYTQYLNRNFEKKHPGIFYAGKELNNIFVEVALQYTDELESHEISFANNIHTVEGGTHLTGFKAAITRTLNDYARKNGFLKEKDDNLSGDDVREGLTSVISVKIKSQELQFEGQTKAKLGNTEARTAVEAVINTEFADWLDKNPNDARSILEKVLLASKARLAAKAARETVLRKGALEGMTLPGKLADCSSRDASESELFIVEGDSAGGCFSGDTKIALVDGRNLSFKQLVEESKKGKQNFCYTIDKNGHIAIAPIWNPRITKKNAEVVKVVLDNNEEIFCTPDHKFMLRDGSYKEARYLNSNDSLMPLYRQLSKIGRRITIKGYELVFDNRDSRWIFTHVLSDQYNLRKSVYGENAGPHRHHKDFNKLNNNPNNLIRLSKEEHLKIHQEIADTVLRSPEVLEKLRKIRQTPEFKEKIRGGMLKIRDLLSKRAKKQWENEEYKNFMTSKFLEFYNSNANYRNSNNRLLNEQQKQYWSNLKNRKAQSERTRVYYENHPEDIEWRSVDAKKQWQDPELLFWRREETKKQWTSEFRAKRRVAYDKTYFENSLKLLKQIWERDNSLGKYDKERVETKNKNALSLRTFSDRFFDGNREKVQEAVQNYNHKVTRVEKLAEKIGVYDIEVPETHNFALASGVFVHNSSKQGRNRKTQAILPLKGKILNVEKARVDKMLAHQEIRALIIALGTAIAEEFDINKLRYHKIVIMTDADVDGAHIRTLLLTLFYRYFPKIIEDGYLYIAQPPLYKIQKGSKISYAYGEPEKEKILSELRKAIGDSQAGKAKAKPKRNGDWEVTAVDGNDGQEVVDEDLSSEALAQEEKISGVSIQRYKGLGEMNPEQLWETTLDPANRVLLQVKIKDASEADKIFDILMGSDVLPRKKFIQTHAKSVQNLDV